MIPVPALPPDISVYSCSGIPSGVQGLVDHPDIYFIQSTFQQRSNLHFKSRISIFPLPGQTAVNKHSGIHIYTVKPKADLFLRSRFLHLKFLMIPPNTVTIKVMHIIDHIVMRNIYFLKKSILWYLFVLFIKLLFTEFPAFIP